jgi:hypothetical protein
MKTRRKDVRAPSGAGCAEILPGSATAEADKSRQMTTKADIFHNVDICRHLSAFVGFLRIRPRLLSALRFACRANPRSVVADAEVEAFFRRKMS